MKISSLRIFALVLALLAGTDVFAQEYRSHIQDLYAEINSKLRDEKAGLYRETTDTVKRENVHSWLWPLCALIQATNELEVLEPKSPTCGRSSKPSPSTTTISRLPPPTRTT